MKLETFLDVLLIEEIPVENATDTGLVGANGQQFVRTERAARKPQTGKVISADTKFPWYGQMVDMPYKIGDIVRTNEFGRDYILLDPEDEFKPGATKYYLIHYADVQGRVSAVNLTCKHCRREIERFYVNSQLNPGWRHVATCTGGCPGLPTEAEPWPPAKIPEVGEVDEHTGKRRVF